MIVQSLAMHDELLKHKAVLDQLRKRLSILGVLEEIEKSSSKFEHIFVHKIMESLQGLLKRYFACQIIQLLLCRM